MNMLDSCSSESKGVFVCFRQSYPASASSRACKVNRGSPFNNDMLGQRCPARLYVLLCQLLLQLCRRALCITQTAATSSHNKLEKLQQHHPKNRHKYEIKSDTVVAQIQDEVAELLPSHNSYPPSLGTVANLRQHLYIFRSSFGMCNYNMA